jgi:exopolyphosphatase / guanosine-5'-triphosphate,3'-diphosphate pyrophosphatase
LTQPPLPTPARTLKNTVQSLNINVGELDSTGAWDGADHVTGVISDNRAASASIHVHGSNTATGGTSEPTARSPLRRTPGGEAPAYAALDLGTNNCRLLVARPSRRGFKVIDAFSRIIRLGEGVTASGLLNDAAMNRTFSALQICATKIRRHRVSRSRLVATEACRIASNGPEFLDRVQRDLGLSIEILSREDEARLAVSGCASLIDQTADLVLVFDIGGGSSELIWLDLAAWRAQQGNRTPRRSLSDRVDVQGAIRAWTSLPVGVVTLAERSGGRFIDEAVYEDMIEHVSALIAPFEAEARVAPELSRRNVHMLGTSGTVTTVAGVHLGLARYDRSRVDGCWITTGNARLVANNLLHSTHDERVAEPCIGHERADLVLAGCAILEALIRTWPCERLRVADRGLREGILTTLMSEDNTGSRGWE